MTGEPIRFVENSEALNRWFDVYAFRTGEPESRKVAVIFNNITERKLSEQALRESEKRLNAVIENLSEGLIIADLEGNLIHWNPAALKMHNYSSLDELNRPATEFKDVLEVSTLDGKIMELEEWALPRVFSGETIVNEEMIVRRKDIDWERIFSVGGTCVKNVDGGGIAFVTLMDITERKKQENEIRRLNEDLEKKVVERTAELNAANKELEAFSYSVSHDLRAPLRSMDGFSSALLDDYGDRLDATGVDYLHRVRKASSQMARLIDDMLLLSRVTRDTIEKKDTNLSEIAQSIADKLLETQPREGVKFTIEKNIQVYGDERLLKIALENLLGNAYKFTSKRENAEIVFGQGRNDEGKIEYFVKDNGAGFDMAYADKLFGAFQRLHSAKDFEGTGIGLATVQRVVRRHGGRVRAEGKPGEGAAFYFTL